MYLTQAAICNQGASLELLLSSHCLTYSTWGTTYIKHQLSPGPMFPSNHNMPFSCSSPLADQAPPHDHQHSQHQCYTFQTTLHVMMHCTACYMDVTLHYTDFMQMLHQCYTSVTPGIHKLTLWVT